MKDGDILLFPAKNWIGAIIQWATGSPWSHCAICISGQLGLVVEAQAGLVRSIHKSKLGRGFSIFRVREEYPYNVDGVVGYLMASLNSKYDWSGVLYLGVLKLLSKIGFNTKNSANKWQKDRDYFCSELCYDAFLKGGGIDIVPDVPGGDVVSPGDIATSKIIYMVLADDE